MWLALRSLPMLMKTAFSMQARLQLQEVDEDADREAALWNAGALFDKFRHQSLRSQRVALIAARDDGDLDDEVLRTVLEGLDIEEAAAEERVRRRRAGSARPGKPAWPRCSTRTRPPRCR